MAEDRLDREIKAKIGQHSSSLDVDAFWSNLEPHIQEKKRRRFLWIWWLPVLLVTGVVLLTLWRSNHDSFLPSDAQMSLESDPKASVVSSDTSPIPKTDHPKSIESNLESKNESLIKEEITEPINSSLSEDHTEVVALADSQITSNEAKKELSTISASSHTTPHQGAKEGGSDFLTDHSQILPETELAENINKIDETEKLDERFVRNSLSFNSIDLLKPNIVFQAGHENILLPVTLQEYKKEENPNTTTWVKSLGVFTSLGQTQRNLSAVQPDSMDILLSRQSGERSLESLGAGVEFTMAHHSGFSFWTDLNYLQINEEFNHRYTFDSIVTLQDVEIGTKTDAQGITEKLYGTAAFLNTYEVQDVRYNRYRFINLGLGIGYTRRFESWGISLRTGINYNLLSQHSGYIFGANNSIVEIDDNNFKKNIGIASRLQFRLNYYFSPKASVWIAPSYVHHWSAINSESNNIEQRYRLYQVQLGYSHHF